jgi:anti-sigma B factor antagonist
MQIETREESGVTVLDLSGMLDGGPESRTIHETVKRTLDGGGRKIVLNMREVPWANTLGIGILIASFVSAKRMEGQLKMFGASERVSASLKMMRLIPEIFDDLETEQAALDSFARS